MDPHYFRALLAALLFLGMGIIVVNQAALEVEPVRSVPTEAPPPVEPAPAPLMRA